MEAPHPRRVTRRSGSQVLPLELFFDLVFVLAITQCTALMAAQPTWAGLGRALLVLAVLWWAWTAYAWLTSVIDPEADATRITMFAAMSAMLVASGRAGKSPVDSSHPEPHLRTRTWRGLEGGSKAASTQ